MSRIISSLHSILLLHSVHLAAWLSDGWFEKRHSAEQNDSTPTDSERSHVWKARTAYEFVCLHACVCAWETMYSICNKLMYLQFSSIKDFLLREYFFWYSLLWRPYGLEFVLKPLELLMLQSGFGCVCVCWCVCTESTFYRWRKETNNVFISWSVFSSECLTPASRSELMADCFQRAGTVCLNVKVIRSGMQQGSTGPERDRERQMGWSQGKGTRTGHINYPEPSFYLLWKLFVSFENTKRGSEQFVYLHLWEVPVTILEVEQCPFVCWPSPWPYVFIMEWMALRKSHIGMNHRKLPTWWKTVKR